MIANQSFKKWVDVTTSDTVNFINQGLGRILCDALFVGVGGTVSFVLEDGTVVAITAASGQYIYAPCKRVNATGTAATGIKALYAL